MAATWCFTVATPRTEALAAELDLDSDARKGPATAGSDNDAMVAVSSRSLRVILLDEWQAHSDKQFSEEDVMGDSSEDMNVYS